MGHKGIFWEVSKNLYPDGRWLHGDRLLSKLTELFILWYLIIPQFKKKTNCGSSKFTSKVPARSLETSQVRLGRLGGVGWVKGDRGDKDKHKDYLDEATGTWDL